MSGNRLSSWLLVWGLIMAFAINMQAKGFLKFGDNIVLNHVGFESESDFSNWKVKKGHLSLSDSHQKEGQHSLRWTWKKGDELVITQLEGLEQAANYYAGGQPELYEPAYYKKGLYGGIKMWMYQEQARPGQMVFQVGSDSQQASSNPKYRFSINLNFTGWRAVWVQLNEDALVDGYTGSDKMQSIIAKPSKEAGNGSVFIDHLHLLEFISYKRHSDLIIENNKKDVRVDSYEILKPYKQYLKADYTNAPSSLEIEDMKIIAKRLESLILGDGSNLWKVQNAGMQLQLEKVMGLADNTYKELNITTKDGNIQGRSLFSGRDEHGTKEGFPYQTVIQNTLFPYAIDYRLNNNEDSKEKALTMYRFLSDQGWTAGSAVGTVDHVIRLNGLAASVFLMRDVLNDEEKNAQQACLAWHTRIGNIVDIDRSLGENTDLVRGGALPKLISILLLPDNAQKAGLMKAFKNYIDYVCTFAPGYSDTFKPDYSVFHHRGTYLNSYGISTVNTVAMMRWLLNNTSYALNDNSDEVIRNTIIRQYEIAHGLDLHMGVCGRFPYKNTAIDRFLIPAYAYMATNDNKVIDQELGQIFNYLYKLSAPEKIRGVLIPQLTYSGTFGTLDLMENLHLQIGNQELKPADGNYSLPYSSLSVQRRGNWMATVKGYDKYVWDYETGHKQENNLGRYLSHGSMFLFKNGDNPGMKGAGMDQNDGFHWGYLPGATTKALPIEKVYFKNKPTEKYIEGFHRSFTESTFARGLTANGQNGIFAMELRDDVEPAPEKVLFDSSFRARKSYFFFEDEIVCLGSDISNDDKQYHTITTLFQNNVSKNGLAGKETFINGQTIGHSLDVNKQLDGGVLTDVQGIHYIIPQGYRIILEQNNQASLKKKGGGDYQPTNVPHVKAWLDHGVNPQKQGYEYLVMMDASPKEAQSRASSKAYKVLEKDATAHIVKHDKTNMTGYAIFNPAQYKSHGLVKQVDTPLMLMLKENGYNLDLTIANPDLNLAKWNHNMSIMPAHILQTEAKGDIVSVTLNGNWKPAQYLNELLSVEYSDGQTILKFFTKDGKSLDLPLRKK